jgi:hypothetical protein|tara:strand:+ start:5551 stop:6192 length:642 start_codon:yes stop_codon:yes gene_type:complete
MNELITAMSEINDLNRTHGVVQRGGKKYTEVFVRVEAFRKAFGTSLGINTEILVDDGTRVVVKATVVNAAGFIIGSGFAEEIRGQGNVNKTSALENGETSAIGRALASLGLHGGAYASINELDGVNRKQQAMAQPVQHPVQQPVQPTPQAPPVDTGPQQYLAQRIAELQTITVRSDLGKWEDHYSIGLDQFSLEHPELYQTLKTEFNKRKAML